MNRYKKSFIIWSYLVLLMLTVTACSSKETIEEQNNNVVLDGVYYQIQETAIPNPNEKLLPEGADEGIVRELDIIHAGIREWYQPRFGILH